MDENTEKGNEEIERDIMERLSKEPPIIPWLKDVGEGHGHRSFTRKTLEVFVY